MKRVLNLILTHRAPEEVGLLLEWWRRQAPDAEILLALSRQGIDPNQVDHPDKFPISDPRLHTRDHSRERQSYSAVFAAASKWMAGGDWDFVHFVEFDQLPLVADLNARQVALAESERADVMGFELARVDETNQPHYLHHARDPAFARFWPSISCRADRRVVLSMFGSGSFWRRAAFDAVAAVPEPFPIYLELWLPTAAHHLGCRLRRFALPQANGYVKNLGEMAARITEARAAGAWSIHPVKSLSASMLPPLAR